MNPISRPLPSTPAAVAPTSAAVAPAVPEASLASLIWGYGQPAQSRTATSCGHRAAIVRIVRTQVKGAENAAKKANAQPQEACDELAKLVVTGGAETVVAQAQGAENAAKKANAQPQEACDELAKLVVTKKNEAAAIARAQAQGAENAAKKANAQLQEARNELAKLAAAGETGAAMAEAEAKVEGTENMANGTYFQCIDAVCTLKQRMEEAAAAEIKHIGIQLRQANVQYQNALKELLNLGETAGNEAAKVNAGVKLAVAGAEVAEIETQLRNAVNNKQKYALDVAKAKTDKKAKSLEIAMNEANVKYRKAFDEATQAQPRRTRAAIMQAKVKASRLGFAVDEAEFQYRKTCDERQKQNEKMAVLTAKINTELRRSELVEVLKQEAEANLSNNDQAVADLKAQVDNAKNAWLAAWDELNRLEPPCLSSAERITEKLDFMLEMEGLINDFGTNLRSLDGQGGSAAETAKKARAEVTKSALLYEANIIIKRTGFERQLAQATAGSAGDPAPDGASDPAPDGAE